MIRPRIIAVLRIRADNIYPCSALPVVYRRYPPPSDDPHHPQSSTNDFTSARGSRKNICTAEGKWLTGASRVETSP